MADCRPGVEITYTALYTLLKNHFGYESFRPLQQEIITHVLSGHDCFVLMPTGGGKSLCYQLPALIMKGITLVISPLIALMKDQVDALQANGIQAAFINSSLSSEESAAVYRNLRRGGIKILYLAPERLSLFGFRDFLKTLPLGLIAIDEAHCISEWGHDFRPDYRNLKTIRSEFPRVPVIALTATATQRVRLDIMTELQLASSKVFISSFNRPNLLYRVYPKQKAFHALLHLLSQHKDESVIIYRFSRKDTENLAHDLCQEGFEALPYHAGLAAETRKHTQEKFIRDQVSIIVATIAFGMGIDKPDVRLVIHYDLPKSVEGYYQETGRAGRDGLASACILFYSYGDKIKHEYFIKEIADPVEQRVAQENIQSVIQYCELLTCRRKYLLEYFGERGEISCNACDNCTQAKEEFDATEIAQKIMSAIARTGERFGGGYIADILCGKDTEATRRRGHGGLSVFGIVSDFKRNQIMRIISVLCAKELLIKASGEYPTYALTVYGRQILKNREKILLPGVLFETSLPSGKKEEKERASGELPGLFEKMRELRKKLADESNVPPYVIFGDRTLHEMCRYLPRTDKELSYIFGVGSKKRDQFGAAFLELIGSYARDHNLGTVKDA